MLAGRSVGGGAQIHQRGLGGQRHEPVAQAFRDENSAPGLIIQVHELPAAKAGRTDPEVDHDVDDGAACAHDIFRLAGRHIREVDAPQRSPARHDAVDLSEPELVTEGASIALPRKKSIRNPGNGVSAPSNEEIARKAYALWEDRGRPLGSPDEDWYRAKDELALKATA